MNDSTIIEILLGVLAAAVGAGSYLGSGRAERIKAVGVQQGIEADAYSRAKKIYEGAINSLEEQLSRLRTEMVELQGEMAKLRRSNMELQGQVIELQATNQSLLREIHQLRGKT